MLSIGSVQLRGNMILAPLAGYTDLAFRTICREYGACLCVSEMISCHGLVFQQKKTLNMLESSNQDTPVSYQLFGSDPDIMAEAAIILNAFKPDLIDLNMGCPVRKVTKKGAGAALMSDLKLAERIISTVVKNSTCPVTVKMRSGPDHTTLNAQDLARIAEDNGVSALTVHGRTWKQAFAGTADWEMVKKIKNAVSIPVIGNGDILTYQQAREKLESEYCDGVMIGRASLGNPWVFSPGGRPRELEPVMTAVLRHTFLVESINADRPLPLAATKNHVGKYFKGFSGAASIRKKIYEAEEWATLKTALNEVKEDLTLQSVEDNPVPTSYHGLISSS